MKYKNKRYAIVNKPLASTALYFENTFALRGSVSGILSGVADIFSPREEGLIEGFIIDSNDIFGKSENKKIITDSAIDILKSNFRNLEYNEDLFQLIKSTLELYGTEEFGRQDKIISDFIDEYVNTTQNNLNAEAFINNLFISSATARFRYRGLYAVPIFENIDNPDWIGGDNLQEGIELALLDLPMIENHKCTWEQAEELRKDETSKVQLRNFRLFLDGIDFTKGKDYIQDSLSSKIYLYEKASKKHGFNLIKNTVKAFLNKTSLLKLFTGNPTDLVFGKGNDTPSIIDALSNSNLYSAVSDIGNFGLNIAEARMTRNLGMNESEIEYLVTVKQKLKGE